MIEGIETTIFQETKNKTDFLWRGGVSSMNFLKGCAMYTRQVKRHSTEVLPYLGRMYFGFQKVTVRIR